MNIFSNLKTPEDFQKERDIAVSKKMGISLEEYRENKRKEAEENQRKEHERYLKEKGITEEQYQKRKRRKEKWENSKWSAGLGCLMALTMVVGGFALLIGEGNFIDSSETLKTIILVIAAIWILGLVAIYLGAPIFMLLMGILEKIKIKGWIKIVIGVIITILVFLVFVDLKCGLEQLSLMKQFSLSV